MGFPFLPPPPGPIHASPCVVLYRTYGPTHASQCVALYRTYGPIHASQCVAHPSVFYLLSVFCCWGPDWGPRLCVLHVSSLVGGMLIGVSGLLLLLYYLFIIIIILFLVLFSTVLLVVGT